MKRRAPAKINLSLEVLAARPDGFHDLRGLFCPISLFDELEIEPAENFLLTCSDADLPVDENNLVFRAAQMFARGVLPSVRIHLEKRIPHSAGLGGGSSDAATTLLLLAEMFPEEHSFCELCGLAAAIGSDVPFFLHQSAAWCEGRGEIVKPIALPETLHLLLFKPPFGVSTPWAFKNLAASFELPTFYYRAQETSCGRLVNDLERPVFQKFLLLGLVKNWLLEQSQTVGALMSGSGSTMFALARSRQDALDLQSGILAHFGQNHWTCVTQSLPVPTDLELPCRTTPERP